MNEHTPKPDSSLEDAEVLLPYSLETLDQETPHSLLEDHLSARTALLTAVREGITGEADSADATQNYCELLLIETSKGYAKAVAATPQSEDPFRLGAQLIRQSIHEFGVLASEHEIDLTFSVTEEDAVTDAIEEVFDNSDSEEELLIQLEHLFGNTTVNAISALLQHGNDNINDMRRARRETLKYQALEALKDTGKIALGAAAAAAVVLFATKRRR